MVKPRAAIVLALALGFIPLGACTSGEDSRSVREMEPQRPKGDEKIDLITRVGADVDDIERALARPISKEILDRAHDRGSDDPSEP